MDFIYKPIEAWPGKLKNQSERQRSRFKAGYGNTLSVLERELQHLRAANIVLQVAMKASDMRLDNKPRAGAKAEHPGVILAFDSKYGPLSYPCDTFTSWDDNIRAIALALEHLRTVDRYGVTSSGQQYTGWKALPPPGVIGKPPSREEALRVISHFSGLPLSNQSSAEELKTAYRKAIVQCHPDRGGDRDDFGAVKSAQIFLGIE